MSTAAPTVSKKPNQVRALGVIGVLANGMILEGVTSFWQQVIMGSVIILAVIADQLQQRLQKQGG